MINIKTASVTSVLLRDLQTLSPYLIHNIIFSMSEESHVAALTETSGEVFPLFDIMSPSPPCAAFMYPQ